MDQRMHGRIRFRRSRHHADKRTEQKDHRECRSDRIKTSLPPQKAVHRLAERKEQQWHHRTDRQPGKIALPQRCCDPKADPEYAQQQAHSKQSQKIQRRKGQQRQKQDSEQIARGTESRSAGSQRAEIASQRFMVPQQQRHSSRQSQQSQCPGDAPDQIDVRKSRNPEREQEKNHRAVQLHAAAPHRQRQRAGGNAPRKQPARQQ